MKRAVILSVIVVFLASLFMSGCGHFKPSPGKIKKNARATQQGTHSES